MKSRRCSLLTTLSTLVSSVLFTNSHHAHASFALQTKPISSVAWRQRTERVLRGTLCVFVMLHINIPKNITRNHSRSSQDRNSTKTSQLAKLPPTRPAVLDIQGRTHARRCSARRAMKAKVPATTVGSNTHTEAISTGIQADAVATLAEEIVAAIVAEDVAEEVAEEADAEEEVVPVPIRNKC